VMKSAPLIVTGLSAVASCAKSATSARGACVEEYQQLHERLIQDLEKEEWKKEQCDRIEKGKYRTKHGLFKSRFLRPVVNRINERL
jgi:hypothetical protein